LQHDKRDGFYPAWVKPISWRICPKSGDTSAAGVLAETADGSSEAKTIARQKTGGVYLQGGEPERVDIGEFVAKR